MQKSIADLFNFSGKTVIVTGGAMGIGYGIVQRFHEAGANVVIADIADDAGKGKAQTLGDRALFVHTDVSDETSVKELVKKTVDAYGRIDVLVNNAGIFPNMPVLSMDVALWDRIQAINLRSVFLCSREVGNHMQTKGGGAIVNIASIDALHPSMTGLAAYDASKHGVWGFTKNFALEVSKLNIRVNAVAPGGISTEGVADMYSKAGMNADQMKQAVAAFTAKIPLGRFGAPDDIAMPTLFLASDAASYVTGEIVVVDGGVLLG
jgi:2-deoxy-D-gluconate 3-dehydrogenase